MVPWFSTTNVYTPGVKAVVDKVIEYSTSVAVTLVPAADAVTTGGLLAALPPPVLELPLPHPTISSAAPTPAANDAMKLRSNLRIAAPFRVCHTAHRPIWR
jgi:hypothetical protein